MTRARRIKQMDIVHDYQDKIKNLKNKINVNKFLFSVHLLSLNKANMRRHLEEFSSRTSLHGFMYLSQKKRTRSEKLFWTSALIVSMLLTAAMIHNLLQHYFNNPVVIYSKNSESDVKFLYFPSITICPPLIFNTKKSKTIDYTAITQALKNNVITLNNLTMNE